MVDCSKGVAVLQKPTGKVDASMGDVHPEGNPHYWLDPANGVVIAGNVLEALKKADPANAAYYEANYERFKDETVKRLAGWKSAAQLAGKKALTYHSSWIYFTTAFGMTVVGNAEPLPGIPPTAKHLAALVNMIKRDGTAFLLQESYFPEDAPAFLARQTGIRLIKYPPSCDDIKADSYFKHFDGIISRMQGGK